MGMTIVVVTHELESTFKIADRVTVLDQGEILFIGTVDELRNHPSERIQSLLNRRSDDEMLDPDAYLKTIDWGRRQRRCDVMRNNKINYVIVGAFVSVALVSMVIAIALLTGRTGATDSYNAMYKNVGGNKIWYPSCF